MPRVACTFDEPVTVESLRQVADRWHAAGSASAPCTRLEIAYGARTGEERAVEVAQLLADRGHHRDTVARGLLPGRGRSSDTPGARRDRAYDLSGTPREAIMVWRGIAAVAAVLVMPVMGALLLFWGAVGLRLGGAAFDTHLVFPLVAIGGGVLGLLVGLVVASRLVRRRGDIAPGRA